MAMLTTMLISAGAISRGGDGVGEIDDATGDGIAIL